VEKEERNSRTWWRSKKGVAEPGGELRKIKQNTGEKEERYSRCGG
jgi:hypothetical protein